MTPHSTTYPSSRKIYVSGSLHEHVRVPMREIMLTSTPTGAGPGGEARERPNPPLTVYDTSGPYTDQDASIDLKKGLDPIRGEWIRVRDDVETYPGRTVQAGDRTYVSDHNKVDVERFPEASRRLTLRARNGGNVTQMHYARKGMVTPEMEFVAIRENQRLGSLEELARKQHKGESFGAALPGVITPEFVRD